ncbi:hypothetical protein M407DRAFT_17035 [Tulasnella calospora MUT 4182]|uniref:Cryptic loci regulator 2 N-terminal domain-containing protein n=1 Tax=Tulasnella calospora MUT 4182 TaxID=1051891 RepID=A0A0C3QME6_9AGAM|nr:hypothetical protein M407DRAFT_17035 [Tulasnella calospora MUT 4182]
MASKDSAIAYLCDMDIEDPKRLFRFSDDPARGAGLNVVTPANSPQDDMSKWHLVSREESKSRRWRGLVGTFIADNLGLDISKAWHVYDWPPGYSLWRKVRVGSGSLTPRYDFYLYGFGSKKTFNSPFEFAFHAMWLYDDDFHALGPAACECNLHTGQKQGVINERWLNKKTATRRKPRPTPSAGDPAAYPQNTSAGPPDKFRLFSWTSVKNRLPEKKTGRIYAMAAERHADLTCGGYFRPGEVVWVSIPCLIPESREPKSVDEVIEFWPALLKGRHVTKHVEPHTPGTPFKTTESFRYEVQLLAVGISHTIEENQILSWQAYQLPRVVREQTLKPRMPVEVSPHLLELENFRPLPIQLSKRLHNLPPGYDKRTEISRTFENALGPLAVALSHAKIISRQYCPEYPYRDSRQFGAPELYQGVWWGPEHIWVDDLVRLVLTRSELVELDLSAGLLESSSGAGERGLFGQIVEIMWDSAKSMACFSARLYELSSESDMEIVEENAVPPAPSNLSIPADYHSDPQQHLPKPPSSFRFRLITAPERLIYLPLQAIAGRYDPLVCGAEGQRDLLQRILNPRNLSAFKANQLENAETVAALKRVLGLAGLGPGEWNMVDPGKWVQGRLKGVTDAEKEAKQKYYDRWCALKQELAFEERRQKRAVVEIE